MSIKEKKVVILQSNYLPWKGYFDLIRHADEFIFYDDVQFTTRDWRNRNKIKTPRGGEWISIPCGANVKRLISDVSPANSEWQRDHWNKICLSYSSTDFFYLYKDFFEDFYLKKTWTNLSELNQYLIISIARQFLNLTTRFSDSSVYQAVGTKTDRLVDVLKKAGATEYISGPAAKDYISEDIFGKEGIKLRWMDYGHYGEYRQKFPPFVHEVSIIDLLFNEGPNAIRYLRGT
ncbi:MAG: WbqC family protein [Bacteroidota bacterium]